MPLAGLPDIKVFRDGKPALSLTEIIHRTEDVENLEQVYIGLYLLGYVSALRDRLQEKYGKVIRLTVHSGLRSQKYNDSLSNSAKNSFHVWKKTPQGLRCAVDLSTPDLPLDTFYNEVKDFCRGETYIHKGYGFVHMAPCGPDEEF